jgi:hypothetical protein
MQIRAGTWILLELPHSIVQSGGIMKKLLLSLTFAAMSSAALAAEPLTAQQMDTVTAGVTITPFLTVLTEGTLSSVTGLTVNFTTEQGVVITP